MKVEWVDENDLIRTEISVTEGIAHGFTPVVKLKNVDVAIREAVWVMEWLENKYFSDTDCCVGEGQYQRATAFLASSLVAAWRERQKQEAQL
jgi:hypothetical protein